MNPFSGMATPALWALRSRILDGVMNIGVMVAEGTVPSGRSPADTVQMEAMFIESIDSVLLNRGEKVPAPFWY